MNIQVFDSILPQEEVNFIEETFVNYEFPYYSIVDGFTSPPESYLYSKTDKRHKEHNFLVHILYTYEYDTKTAIENSKYSHMADKILKLFTLATGYQIGKLFRAKVNYYGQCNYMKEGDYNTPHLDMDHPHQVLLYYVNDSDGPTYFFDDDYKIVKVVEPKKGRFILFDGCITHASSFPVKSHFRVGLNVDCLIDNYDTQI